MNWAFTWNCFKSFHRKVTALPRKRNFLSNHLNSKVFIVVVFKFSKKLSHKLKIYAQKVSSLTSHLINLSPFHRTVIIRYWLRAIYYCVFYLLPSWKISLFNLSFTDFFMPSKVKTMCAMWQSNVSLNKNRCWRKTKTIVIMKAGGVLILSLKLQSPPNT